MKLRSPKVIGTLSLLAVLVVFALQNNEQVEVEFLLWNWSMPRVVLIFCVLVVGVLAGWALREWRVHRSADAPESRGWES